MGKPSVNTKSSTDRRALRFETLADLRGDIDRVEAAEAAGQLRRSGNWTAGQTFGHLASWINYPFDGFPMGPAPWFVRLLVGMRKNHYLNHGFPAGVRIPKSPDGTYGTEPVDLREGADRLRRALRRLESGEPMPHPSPVFGLISPSDAVKGTLRHAELHLSFLHPEG